MLKIKIKNVLSKKCTILLYGNSDFAIKVSSFFKDFISTFSQISSKYLTMV